MSLTTVTPRQDPTSVETDDDLTLDAGLTVGGPVVQHAEDTTDDDAGGVTAGPR